MIWPHTITVYPAAPFIDADGTPARAPDSGGVTVAAYVQPAAVDEDPALAQTATVDLIAYLAGDCPPLDAHAAVEFDRGTYELVGEPQRFTDPDGVLVHYRARLRRS